MSVLHQPCAKALSRNAAHASSSRNFLTYSSILRRVNAPSAVRQRTPIQQLPSANPVGTFYYFPDTQTCHSSTIRSLTHSRTTAALTSSSRYLLPYSSTLRRVLSPPAVRQRTHTPHLLSPAPVVTSYYNSRHLDLSLLHQLCDNALLHHSCPHKLQ